jgi:hypothetical protein
MAAVGSTPIKLYGTNTASQTPLAANLANDSGGIELAVNGLDGKLFYKDNSGNVQVLASKGTGSIGGSTTQVQFNNAGALGGSASLTWNGTVLTSSGFAGPLNGTVGATTPAAGSFTTLTTSSTITDNNGTANGVTYLNGSKVVTSGSVLTFDGTNFATSNSMRVTGNTASYASGAGTEITYIAGSTKGGIQVYDRTASAYKDVFLDGANALFQISGSEQMRLTSTGLGIGTSSPADKLEVYSTITARASSGTSALRLRNTTSDYQWQTVAGTNAVSLFDNAVGSARLTLDSSGNVGIGTSSPTAFGAGYTALTLSGSNAGIFQSKNTLGDARLYANTSGETLVGSWANTALKLYTNSTLQATLDGSGNLGLGVTPSAWGGSYKALQNPAGSLSAYSTSQLGLNLNTYDTGVGTFTYVNTAAASRYLQLSGQHQWYSAASGTAGNLITFTQAMTLDASGNLLVGTTSEPFSRGYTKYIAVSSAGSTGFEINAASGNTAFLDLGVNGVRSVSLTTDGATPGLQSVGALPLTFITNGVERMRLDSSGNLLVGTTDNGGANTQGLEVYIGSGATRLYIGHASGTANGTQYAVFNYAGTNQIGSISQSGTTAVLYNTTSDQRLKENIQDADSASSLIDSLQVRKFDWKSDNSHQRYGFVAQELVTVAPEAVHQPADADEMMAVDYSKLVPMLVKEIQSLRKRLADAGI